MNESEWRTCTDAAKMLDRLPDASKRKPRLLAAAWCRRIWSLLSEEPAREAVEVSERFADELASEGELVAQTDRLLSFFHRNPWDIDETELKPVEIQYQLADCLVYWGDVPLGIISDRVLWLVAHAHRVGQVLRSEQWFGNDDWWEAEAQAALTSERAAQASLVRDVFGNPFDLAPIGKTRSLDWDHQRPRKIAQAIYTEGRFDGLPVLADALEEAGCSDPEILSHCRGEAAHVRGCWVLDLMLGKE